MKFIERDSLSCQVIEASWAREKLGDIPQRVLFSLWCAERIKLRMAADLSAFGGGALVERRFEPGDLILQPTIWRWAARMFVPPA
ncbi:MAG: hypothetical protein HYR56_21855 [Acidobacteria bacterium]|nr:hypothetical protein [Acidobacteriota bacterium]MBI3425836.1 hypothetical protein [Acidobacteriota bacterium]